MSPSSADSTAAAASSADSATLSRCRRSHTQVPHRPVGALTGRIVLYQAFGLLCIFLAFASTGCGQSAQEKAVAAEDAAESNEREEQAAAHAECKKAFGRLLTNLQRTNSDLGVGVSVKGYGSNVRRVNRAYTQTMNSGEVGGVDCLTDVGAPAEKAVNYHITAFNVWNDCAYDLGCEDSSIDSRRQRLWRNAVTQTEKANDGLASMSPESVN